MSALATILEEKGTALYAVPPGAPVLEAVNEMCKHRVGAVLVIDGAVPVGILSERDVMTRVVLRQRDPLLTSVASVMTRDLVCISKDTTPEAAMDLMTERRLRHLPVIERETLVGLVSIGDLVRWVVKNQECELRAIRDYVSGPYPAATPI